MTSKRLLEIVGKLNEYSVSLHRTIREHLYDNNNNVKSWYCVSYSLKYKQKFIEDQQKQ